MVDGCYVKVVIYDYHLLVGVLYTYLDGTIAWIYNIFLVHSLASTIQNP